MRPSMKALSSVVLLAAALLTGCGGVPSRGKGSECAGCHAKRTLDAQRALPHLHEPFREATGCDACHQPHGEKGKNVLVEAEPELCLRCHDGDAFQGAKQHSAIQMGGCSGCHEPHAGREAEAARRAARAALRTVPCRRRERRTAAIRSTRRAARPATARTPPRTRSSSTR